MVDLTHQVDNGRLSWDAPQGNNMWKVFSFWEGHTNQISCFNGANGTTPIERGSFVVDHFSKKGAEVHTKIFEEYVLKNESTRESLRLNGNYGVLRPSNLARQTILTKSISLGRQHGAAFRPSMDAWISRALSIHPWI